MKPTDLAHLRFPGAPTISPDGKRAAFAVTRLDLDADEYRSQIWIADLDASTPPRQLTHGRKDGQPRWSPNGALIAFTRTPDKDGSKPQLYVLDAAGGDARQVTDVDTGVGEFAWSPDSASIAYTARVPEEGRYGTVEGRDASKEPPRRLTTFNFRRDNEGFIADRPQHVFVVTLDSSSDAPQTEPKQLSQGPLDHSGPAWSPDGRTVAVLRIHDDARLETDIVLLDVAAGTERIVETPLSIDKVIFDAAGERLLAAGFPSGDNGIDFVGRPPALWSFPLDGSKPELLTDADNLELDVSHAPGLQAEADGSVLLTVVSRGGVHLLRRATDGTIEPVLDGQRQVIGFAAANGTVAATIATPLTSGELVVIRGNEERVLTDLASSYSQHFTVFDMEELETKSDDGYPVHGWIVRPSGPGPHPVLLMVHGGPFAQYGWTLFDEAQVYAGAGYAVVMGNPRGSAGYGSAHGRAIKGDMGNRDTADLMALLEHALEFADLDSSRVGVLGGSYGGFMTAWLAAHEGHRFKAALVERALTAWDSFEGSSDIGWFFGDEYVGTDPDKLWQQSPLAHAHKISIPTLVVHSEQDWRCPVEQAQRLYVTLKKQGTPTELLLFPGEGHELSRSGLPSHRVARFDAVLEWFSRWV